MLFILPECACVQGPGHLHGHLRVLPRDPGVGHRAAAGQAPGQQTQEAGTAVEGELRHGMDGVDWMWIDTLQTILHCPLSRILLVKTNLWS